MEMTHSTREHLGSVYLLTIYYVQAANCIILLLFLRTLFIFSYIVGQLIYAISPDNILITVGKIEVTENIISHYYHLQKRARFQYSKQHCLTNQLG